MAKENEIGALWTKESKNGNKFMSGTIEIDGQKKEVVVFKNTYKKEGEKTPDFRIYQSEPRNEPKPQPGSPADDFQKGKDAFGDDDIPWGNDAIDF